MQVSSRAAGVVGSVTLEIDAKAKKMKADGIDVVGFGAGEPDFPTPQFVIDAAKDALDKGLTRYTPAAGLLELRQAICDKLQKDNGVRYAPAQIVVSNGAKHALYNTFQAILEPGDEVLIPSPYWVSYPEMVKMAGGVPVFVPGAAEDGFKPSLSALRAACTPRTVAMILNSPSNPTGAIYTRQELEGIAALAVEKQFYIISDEIYEELTYDGAQHISIASLGKEIYEQTIVINGMSKAHAMTGWRIGYSAAPVPVAKVIANYQSHATSNANTIAQWASVAALTGPRDDLEAMVREFAARRDYLCDRIEAIPGLSCVRPGGAFYVMMRVSGLYGKSYEGQTISNSMDFAGVLLDQAQVAVVPGVAFGADEYVRLSYATSRENIEKGMDRIAAFVQKLK
ncbi:pyridoxal phosphate-dependent aminotransferase [Christensenellaceae bacterium NSJ-44]|uniref:Aminotransferase n=1 Tax=Luoshenia tenuis TaxID=2763654 RepID=A0A926CZP5_9FIRM|nr:pyridoxal phosphate-dependent aminotransferase [Luoshenia tenuis]MBC8529705.1 pyridoxal phosphate-dependent aminotransferase [Luoshenia tenuis]